MDLRVMMCIKLALATIIVLLCVLPLGIESQNSGCSLQGLQLDKCLNQEGQYVFLKLCCRALNQALRVGFHCLCSVFMNDAPQLTTLFSLSFSSCYITVPPFTMCRDLGTMPISLPIPSNNSAKDIRTAQQTPLVPQPTPSPLLPQAIGGPVDLSTLTANSTAVEQQSHPSKNVMSMLHVVENANNVSSSDRKEAHLFCFHCWLLSLALYALAFT